MGNIISTRNMIKARLLRLSKTKKSTKGEGKAHAQIPAAPPYQTRAAVSTRHRCSSSAQQNQHHPREAAAAAAAAGCSLCIKVEEAHLHAKETKAAKCGEGNQRKRLQVQRAIPNDEHDCPRHTHTLVTKERKKGRKKGRKEERKKERKKGRKKERREGQPNK